LLPISGGEQWHLLQGWQPGQAQETWVSEKGMHSGQPYLVWFISITSIPIGIALSYPYHLLISGSIALGQVSLGDSSSESRASPLAEETGPGYGMSLSVPVPGPHGWMVASGSQKDLCMRIFLF